jgi:hypothetical protein
MAPVVVVCPCVFTVGRWSTRLPANIAGISIPSGKIWFSRRRGVRKRWTTHVASGSGRKGRP